MAEPSGAAGGAVTPLEAATSVDRSWWATRRRSGDVGQYFTSPASRRATASRCWCGVSLLGLPMWTRAACAYRKSNPDIFVMQSAEDRAANNTS
jgi:hypothetical protein